MTYADLTRSPTDFNVYFSKTESSLDSSIETTLAILKLIVCEGVFLR